MSSFIILAQQNTHLSVLDYAILGVYMLGMVGIGVWFSRGQENEEEFLMGGRSMHWLLVTFAAVATAFSGVSLIGAPGYAFSNDSRMLMTAPASLLALPIILLVLPFLVRLRITTVYEYLEQRFSVALRLIASALFLGTKFIYVGVVIYTPALLLSTSVGIPLLPSILLMGCIATALTMMGGMKAVMWSDAIQFVIMMLGIGVILFVLLFPDSHGLGGAAEYWKIADHAGRTRLWDFSFNLSELTTWSIIVCMAMAGLGSTFSDQVMMQRYFAAGGSKAVAKSYVMSTLVALPTVVVLYVLGILLFGFYGTGRHFIPDEIRANGDKVLPFFVSTQLPTGLKGLVIAAIVAATLSTVSSVLNSLCTATVTDFYQRFRKGHTSGRSDVALSRWLTIFWGGFGTLLACYVDRLGMIIEQTQILAGLVGGGLGGIFFLGLFTKRANSTGTIVGAIVGTMATAYVMWETKIHFMWYYVVGMGVCVIVGYLVSLILPSPAPAAQSNESDLPTKPDAIVRSQM
ncbi:MAG: sodium/solute symporter [Phycisphaerales bacterium]|jgi:SSS family transporter|nr:sodium/solute symporter [Phycisphaerales bacterium]